MSGLDIIRYVFDVCIGAGFAVPLFSLLIGTFGSLLDFDVDLDADTGVGALVPFNLMSLCFALIVFGALGRFSVRYMDGALITIAVFAILLLYSLLGYILFYRLVVRRLRTSAPSALRREELTGKTGILTLRVTGDSDGMISLADSTGASISYRARLPEGSEDGTVLPQGERVVVVGYDIRENVCYVDKIS